ncbi:MAG TPA: hypothetical protein VLJ16_00960, partial [Acidobacteriota bacterium]|nr:hypothetical protein [Acidobacteriota bacterium]
MMIIRIPALFLALALPLLPQAARIPSNAAPAPTIDGRADDWPASTFGRDARSGAECSFRNDGRDLYVLFIVRDPKARESLASTGLAVLAGKAGSKKSDRGILCLERAVPAETYILWREGQGELLGDAEKARIRETPSRDLRLTFAIGSGGSVQGPLRRLQASEPPEFAIGEEPDATTFEIKVPLASPKIVPGGLGIAPGQAVRITFEWGGASRKVLSARTN